MRARIPASRSIILTPEALHEAVDYFLQHDAFAFDVETTGDNRGVPTRNDVTWIALATHGKTVVIPMGHPNGNEILSRATKRKNRITGKFDTIPAVFTPPPDQLTPSTIFTALRPLFFSDRIKIAHNATFDLISIAKYYDDTIPPGPHHDTIVIQHILNENLMTKGLKALVEKYWSVKYDHENVGRKVENHEFWKVAHYAYMDAKYTWLLWNRLEPHLHTQDEEGHDLTEIFQLETDLIPVLCDMGMTGAPVDVEELHRLDVELSERIVDVLARTYKAAGKKFNLNSAAQKAELLFSPKSAGGQGLKPKVPTDGGKKRGEIGLDMRYSDWSTAAQHLEDYYAGNTLVGCILEYQEVNKLLTTYVQGYLGVEDDPARPCRIFDGRVHTDLVQYGTVTGRFSSREPNLQNTPRPDTELGRKIRGLFTAPPGYKMVVADYGQIEMILLAHFAGPGPLFHGIHAGMDPHSATAAALLGMDPNAFMDLVAAGEPSAKAGRQVAKGINFAVVYGAGPEKVASMAGINLTEAKRFLKIHQQEFPEIYRFKDAVITKAKTRRPPHIRTLLGRKRRLPALFAQDYGARGYAERQAVNSLIQGSAADIIKLAMVRLHSLLPPEMKLILSVHDELVTLVPQDQADLCRDLVHEAMLGDGIANLIKVPLSSDIKIVDRWSEAK